MAGGHDTIALRFGIGIGRGRPRDEVMAAALIDRLLHHGHVVNIRGNS